MDPSKAEWDAASETIEDFRLRCRQELASVFDPPPPCPLPEPVAALEAPRETQPEQLGEVVFTEPITFDEEPRIPEVMAGREPAPSDRLAELEPLVYTAVLAAVRAVLAAKGEQPPRSEHPPRSEPSMDLPGVVPTRLGVRAARYRRPDRRRGFRPPGGPAGCE